MRNFLSEFQVDFIFMRGKTMRSGHDSFGRFICRKLCVFFWRLVLYVAFSLSGCLIAFILHKLEIPIYGESKFVKLNEICHIIHVSALVVWGLSRICHTILKSSYQKTDCQIRILLVFLKGDYLWNVGLSLFWWCGKYERRCYMTFIIWINGC